MSYCVNCGVELDPSAKKCALCNTPVINPNIIKVQTEEKPFSDKIQIPRETKRTFIAFAVSIFMFIPTVVTFFLNVFFLRYGFWSFYVFSTVVLLWIVFVLPFFAKKINPYVLWAADTLSAAVYCFILATINKEKIWLLFSFLSLIGILSAGVLLFLIWTRKKHRHWTANVIFVFLALAVVSVSGGECFSVFSHDNLFFIVGVVFAVCFFALAMFFVYCNKSKYVKAWLNKIFHI